MKAPQKEFLGYNSTMLPSYAQSRKVAVAASPEKPVKKSRTGSVLLLTASAAVCYWVSSWMFRISDAPGDIDGTAGLDAIFVDLSTISEGEFMTLEQAQSILEKYGLGSIYDWKNAGLLPAGPENMLSKGIFLQILLGQQNDEQDSHGPEHRNDDYIAGLEDHVEAVLAIFDGYQVDNRLSNAGLKSALTEMTGIEISDEAVAAFMNEFSFDQSGLDLDGFARLVHKEMRPLQDVGGDETEM